LVLALALALAGCSPTDSGARDGDTPEPDARPAWLTALIQRLEAQPVANPPAYIARREHAAGVFYYLPSRCCDIPSDLYDVDGTLVCHPDGGITGGGDGRCPALGAPLREEIVWRDTRTP